MKKLTSLEILASQRDQRRSKSLRLVWTSGHFTVLDIACVKKLQEARRMGDILAVGIKRNESVGDRGRHDSVPQSQIAELVGSLDCVDYVVLLDDDFTAHSLHQLQPDVIHDDTGGPVRIDRSTARQDSEPSLVDRFSVSKTIVIGDIMLDEYVSGSISRISPEAPVPVLDVEARRFTCGGAANVAANVASLSGVASLGGRIGADSSGAILREKLQQYGIQLSALVESKAAQTICKTRFVAGQQQIVRVDQERRAPLSDPEREELIAQVRKTLPEVHVCILSDYAKGLLDEQMCRDLIALCREHAKPTIVDPKGSDFLKYRGCSLITPNLKEAGIAAGCDIRTIEDLYRVGEKLLEILPGTTILITRGADGMTLFRPSKPPLSIPTVARTVYDVVGAGDTAIATLAVALGAGFGIEEAIQLANIAAGIAVERHGTAAVGIDELAARPEALEMLQACSSNIHSSVSLQ